MPASIRPKIENRTTSLPSSARFHIAVIAVRSACARSSAAASLRLPHFRDHLQSLLPTFLDELLDRRVAHLAIRVEVLSLAHNHCNNLEVVRRPSLSTLANRLNSVLFPVLVQ